MSNKTKTGLISILISTSLMCVSAQANDKDFCTKLAGFWVGETHLKSQTECNQFNGCSHLVMINAEQSSDSKYHVKMHFTDGVNVKEQQVDITCENGKITLPVPLKETISTACDSSNHCIVVFDNPRFSAELIKR